MSFSNFAFSSAPQRFGSFADDDESSEGGENTNMSMDAFCDLLLKQKVSENNQSTLYKILPLVYPYLTTTDILACANVNTRFHQLSDIIWKEPDFNKFSYVHDALFMFNKFLAQVQKTRPTTLSKIQSLDLFNIQETLYDQVNPNFFRIIVQYCHNLRRLDLSNAEFLSHKSLPKDYWSLPQVTVLNLSNCSQVNDDMIVNIARGCRQLIRVTLDNLSRLKGKGLAGLAAECDQLEYVSARFNTSMEDQALTALAKFRHIRLHSLDLTGCTKLTSVGFEILARYCAHLTSLSLSQTSCQLAELRKFICILRNTRVLDISGCKNLLKDEIADWIWNSEFHQLKELTMDTSIANAIVHKSQIQLVDATIRQVTVLTLINLPERTPISYLYELLTVFPYLEHVSFKRAYFETDFMLGTYRTPSPEDEEYITDANIERFNYSQSHVHVAMIKEREDNGNLLNW